ncbi:ParA family protein [Xanthomonas hortorum]|uniref:ParA family protein n=1 Tax=Xanthomonas hortorum TaxID=56454 RepID=A0AA47EWU7_9XANT|nr:ParA family protein [Xanthomonas hortorum]WAH65580.1 ParA family protein [Xanthomonas hortorum]
MAKNIESKKTPVLAVLNMKGGVGKTTIAANVMRLLYKQFSKRTILVDFDPAASTPIRNTNGCEVAQAT